MARVHPSGSSGGQAVMHERYPQCTVLGKVQVHVPA
jgi:hypothetical protein